MDESFAEALDDLIDEHLENGGTRATVISALTGKLAILNIAEKREKAGDDGAKDMVAEEPKRTE